MKYIFAILLLLLLAACQPRVEYVPVPVPVQQVQPPQQAIAQPPLQQAPPQSMKAPELGPVEFKIFAYGARDVTGSVNPGTPLEYRIKVKKAEPGNPPVTPDYPPKISMVVTYNDGTTDLYGTPDMAASLAYSNVITYDPALESWINTYGISQGSIGAQRFVITVTLNGQTKVIQHSVNVR